MVKAGPGSLGPVNMPIPVVIDRTVAAMSDFAAGANIDGKHSSRHQLGSRCRYPGSCRYP
ncbi:hypothetical protein ACVXHA_08930 [Escherichia coli]